MSTISIDTGRFPDQQQTLGRSGFAFLQDITRRAAGILAAWREYRELQAMDALPFEVRKDIGFPASEHMNGK